MNSATLATVGRTGTKLVALERIKLSWILTPSIEMLVNEVRFPATVGLVRLLSETPPMSPIRLIGLRPFSGRRSICSW